MTKEFFAKLAAGVLVALLSVNIFFVKRLVDKLDSNEMMIFQLRQEMAVLSARFDTLSQIASTNYKERK